mmetsp:Transcript_24780/g.21985  ORF Transcript_24780/g.21985 Transcript_24780/m.21985 type:complete len:385 (+) Transcript_24780:92-1246(+)
MDTQVKSFNCKLHPSETIQRVQVDACDESPLKCIECILSEHNASQKGKYVTLKDFINQADKFYSDLREFSVFEGGTPGEFVEFLTNEDEVVQKLQEHVNQEKLKVEQGFNDLIKTFGKLCKARKDEVYESLDKQLINVKANFAYYKSKLDRYFNPDATEDFIMNKSKIIDKINNSEVIEDLDLIIKNIKDDMQENEKLAEATDKKQEIKNALSEAAKELQVQMKDLPKTIFFNYGEAREQIEKLEENVEKYLDKFTDIDPFFNQFSLTQGLGMDTKILKKHSDQVMVRKWLKEHAKMGNLKLVYRATRDGFSAQDFHSKANGHSHTIVIAKSNMNKIFGGYADKDWGSNNGNYAQSNDCWLFSVTEKTVFKQKNTNQQYAIYCN